MYKREATEYDTDYVKKYDEDLNTALIFVRRSSLAPANHLTCSHRRVSSAFVIDVHSNLQPDPNEQSAALLPLSSSLSISLPSPAKLLPPHLFRKIHRARPSLPPASCMQVF